ncbi:Heterogeneous nuclear ribonucleoprotein F [Orchesella cincta]|uniref:Heterogeneous nuclear ribonucleoprotein F n=1 Tax=Orchesella cincta TaxID=48709 RepID=A0A1D2NIP7_ORCCI|nr:Heterogeneous nuclear ribonucleoprotein F [Orchesella cincta]
MTDAGLVQSAAAHIDTSNNFGYLIGCGTTTKSEAADGGGGAGEEEFVSSEQTGVNTELDSDSSESNSRNSNYHEGMDHIVKLRGLPWSCTKDDIVEFLGPECQIYGDAEGVHLVTSPEGKASGEALVELASDHDQDVALKKDKQNMGHRYIEVFKITRSEMEWVLKRSRPTPFNNGSHGGGRNGNFNSSDTFVRLRGLPYDCSKEDIYQFFHGLEIVANGIQLMVDGRGMSSGEAYVQFTSKDQAQKALGKDREMIKHRYVEIFTVSASELRNMQSMVPRGGRTNTINNRSGPYDRPNPKGDSRYGNRPPPPSSRYFNKGRGGFENDSWNNSYDSWGSGGSGSTAARSNNNMHPPPLIPGLKKNREVEGNTRHCVLMRGLPFRADENDIRKFFAPLMPTAVHIIYESNGRPSGTAKVNFVSNDDVTRAMAKHKDRMEHRYIELFVHRT